MSRKTSYVPIIKEEVVDALRYQNMTQRDLASALDISYEHLNRCLSNGKISKTWLISIAKILDISVGTLSGTDNEGFTYFGEERGKLLAHKDEIFITLCHLCGFGRERYEVMEDWEVSNMFSDISLLIGWHLNNCKYSQEHDDTTLPF